MVRIRILITSVFLWVNAMSLNLPYCWDPISQTWSVNQGVDQSAVMYVMPEASQMKNHHGKLLSAPMENHNRNRPGHHQDKNNCCECSENIQDLIVIDTDCGADDAMAIAMILNGMRNKSGISVAGITCTSGSTDVHSVTKNVIKTLKACDRLCEIPVYAGSDRGLVREITARTSKYGDDAFGDFYYFPDVDEEQICDEHPAIFISNLVREHPGKVTIMCMGPLANIAIAAHLNSDLYHDVKQICYLGGNIAEGLKIEESGKGGSANEPAELPRYRGNNNEMDTFAAMAVFNRPSAGDEVDGPKVIICPEEVYNSAVFPWEWREELDKKGTKMTDLVKFAESKLRKHELSQGWPCWSPILAAAIIDQKVITEEETGFYHVMENGRMTGFSTKKDPSRAPNLRVIKDVDHERVRKLIYSCL